MGNIISAKTKMIVGQSEDAPVVAPTANDIRQIRDALLAATDWRFRSDMSPSQAWVDYCQALRDVPAQDGFPEDVVWPKQPL